MGNTKRKHIVPEEFENLRTLTHGRKQLVRCILYENDKLIMSEVFEKHYQAVAYGKNWVMLGKNRKFNTETIK